MRRTERRYCQLTAIRLDPQGKREMVFSRVGESGICGCDTLTIDADDTTFDNLRVGDYCQLEWTQRGLNVREAAR